jgi:hypothetical protein
VRESVPVDVKLEVVQVATPEARDWEPQPVMVVPPLWKLTVPVGVTPGPETVAVRVVEAPTVVGLGDEVRAVELVVAATTRESEPVEPE